MRAKKENDDEDEDNDFFFSFGWWCDAWDEGKRDPRFKVVVRVGLYVYSFIRTCIAFTPLVSPNLVCCVLFHDFHLWVKHIHKSYAFSLAWAWTHTTPQTNPTQYTNTSAHHHYHQSSYYILKSWEKMLETSCLHLFFFFVCTFFQFFLPFGYFLLLSSLSKLCITGGWNAIWRWWLHLVLQQQWWRWWEKITWMLQVTQPETIWLCCFLSRLIRGDGYYAPLFFLLIFFCLIALKSFLSKNKKNEANMSLLYISTYSIFIHLTLFINVEQKT